MKHLPLVLCFVLAALTARAQTDAPHIKAEAQKCVQALLARDYDHFVAYVPSRLLERMGGRNAMIDTIKKGLAVNEGKYSIKDAQIGEPEKTRRIGTLETALVPQKLVIGVPGGKLEADAYMLGVSEDEGKTWQFIDVGSVTREQLATLYPEFKDQLHLPATQKPVFTKD